MPPNARNKSLATYLLSRFKSLIHRLVAALIWNGVNHLHAFFLSRNVTHHLHSAYAHCKPTMRARFFGHPSSPGSSSSFTSDSIASDSLSRFESRAIRACSALDSEKISTMPWAWHQPLCTRDVLKVSQRSSDRRIGWGRWQGTSVQSLAFAFDE
jgi:hypothetical protein